LSVVQIVLFNIETLFMLANNVKTFIKTIHFKYFYVHVLKGIWKTQQQKQKQWTKVYDATRNVSNLFIYTCTIENKLQNKCLKVTLCSLSWTEYICFKRLNNLLVDIWKCLKMLNSDGHLQKFHMRSKL
jgi:hypothetical protein